MKETKTDILSAIRQLHGEFANDNRGQLADYIPQLAKVDPRLFAISIATVSGEVFSAGDATVPFTIQSMSKPFVYGMALENFGHASVENRIGVEPTGEDFNSYLKLDANSRPYNPMVNPGAITTTHLIRERFQDEAGGEILKFMSRCAGRKLDVDFETYRSEVLTADKNRAISYLLKHKKCVSGDVEELLNTYFMQCSVKVTTSDLAIMAATLANKGVCPLSGDTVFKGENLRRVLSVLLSCGMYNYAGQWIYEVGLPAKSGVSGGILAVVPGVMGIAVYSPLLDERGTSIRAINVCKELSSRFNLHILDFVQTSF